MSLQATRADSDSSWTVERTALEAKGREVADAVAKLRELTQRPGASAAVPVADPQADPYA